MGKSQVRKSAAGFADWGGPQISRGLLGLGRPADQQRASRV